MSQYATRSIYSKNTLNDCCPTGRPQVTCDGYRLRPKIGDDSGRMAGSRNQFRERI